MSRFRFPLLGLFGVSFVLWLTSSCNSDDDKCVRGETRLCSCVGIDRPRGSQTCQGDNTYGECDCSGNGIAGSSGTDGPEELRILIGRPCKDDAGCGEGLGCITAESNDFAGFGGVAGGYCTTTCNTATTATDCAAIDPDSDCLAFDGGGNGLCFRTCTTGAPDAVEDKCLGRRDLACASEAALFNEGVNPGGPGWCLPRCNSDAECPGRFCSPLARDGLCRDAQPPGLPFGAACTIDGDCASQLCLRFSDTEAACSQQCVYRGVSFSPAACGYAAPPREAGCLFPQFASAIGSEGFGDYGVCLELCEADADCTQADTGWFCRLDQATAVQTIAQRSGYCLPPSARQPDAGAGDGGLADAGGLVPDASISVDGG
jgi:hypothetical protein